MSLIANSQLETVGVRDPENFKHFTLYKSLVNLRICPSDSDVAIFYVDNSVWLEKWNIRLYNGADNTAPIIGVAHLRLAGSNTVGLGNPSTDPNGMVWEEFERLSKWGHGKYQFEYPPNTKEGRTKYTWNRVSRTPITGGYRLQLVEESNPEVVLAAFVTGPGMRPKTKGTLMIRTGKGENWERMVWLTVLSIIELTRRRLRRRRIQL
jgi:hypothetical protein